MSGKQVKLQRRRNFSESFKKERVKEYESGSFTVLELSKLFNIRHTTLYRWIYKYSTYQRRNVIMVEMKDSASKKLKDYEQKIADLERALGQKQLNIEYLEKLIEIANQTYSIDIKKNANTPRSPGSRHTDKS